MKSQSLHPYILSLVRRELRQAMQEQGQLLDRFNTFGDSSVTFYHPKRSVMPSNYVAEEEYSVDEEIHALKQTQITKEDIKKLQSEETFSQRVLHLIDSKNLKDADVYKAAGMDRRLFSKLRSNKDYQPTKTTALVLCLALRLSPGEARDLLELAGFSFSRASGRDIIVHICLEHRIYQLMEVNTILYEFLYEPF